MNNNDIYVSLDIGTSTVKVLIGEMAGDTLNVIGIGKSDSNGIKKGSIVDIDETVRSIRNAVEQAERMVGSKVQSAIVGITGNHIQLHPCHGVVAVSSDNREIGDDDIARVMEAAQVMPIAPEREIIDVIHHEFIVDGLEGINDPRGMVGVRLEMKGTVITGSKTILHNLQRCVEKAGLEIADICLTPLALGSVALSSDEKNLGVALVDIGGGSTKVALFEQGVLVDTFILPIGGNHVTKDVSIGLRTSTENAESIKLKYGHASIDLASIEETFTVSKMGRNGEETFSQQDLAYIIEPRVAEILELVRTEIRRHGFVDVPGGYIFTGGVTAMEGFVDLAQHELDHNVRVAIPDYIGVREPQYTTCVGLIKFAYHNVRIQGREIAVAIAPDSNNGHPKKSKVKQENSRQRGGVTKKVKQLFDSFFD
ncbi:cell division protein FtsA [Pullulanibacillus pueri]|uniref:Cell division protein FtsA n=1 Tax=Pullulanibacillus pueri TaxID=1437324 RepID=A0A8J3EKF6_9BACL|nr:cell division protein FtsA [Pullulanibacillus pueri]MBM7680140.1 cell division protein FtsA [Pullulanibacillus pueri]GGH74546.1 cell division protein FtsA [Pullulanibacillus pueri]